MRLLVVRHAIAEERGEFATTGQDDSLRPLTTDGVRKMRRGVRGLRTVVRAIDAIVTSPFARAAHTAEILRAEYEADGVQANPVLQPETPIRDVVVWLRGQDASVTALVGHEPQLGRLISYLLGAGDRSAVELKKGAACLLEIDGEPGEGAARMVWLLPPSVLRDLAG